MNKYSISRRFRSAAFCLSAAVYLLLSLSLAGHTQERDIIKEFFADKITICLEYENVKIGALEYQTTVRPKTGIALSGGGLRGLAQIGVIDELLKAGIPVDNIAGSSIGSIVGGLFAVGYSGEELEEFATSTDWENIFIDSPERRTMFIGQKSELNRHFAAFRFEGMRPYIPQAVSQGQQVSTLIHSRILHAGFHPNTHFDDLKIPLRIIATNMLTGAETVFENGDLAQSIMASISVPLLFSPVKIDSNYYWDAGMVNNIPTDVARNMGSDLVITVDTTAPLRSIQDMVYPWQHFDQGTTIMQQSRNREALKNADIVIKPDLTGFQAYEIESIPEFIRLGREAARQAVPEIKKRLDELNAFSEEETRFVPEDITVSGNTVLSDETILSYITTRKFRTTTFAQLKSDMKAIFDSGYFSEVCADIEGDDGDLKVTFRITENPEVQQISFRGNTLFPGNELRDLYRYEGTNLVNYRNVERFINDIMNRYELEGKSLARVTDIQILESDKRMIVTISEGRLNDIKPVGLKKTKSHVALREFPLKKGDLFDRNKAQQGIANIYGTNLFQRVYPVFSAEKDSLILEINLEEKQSEQIRLGARYDIDKESKGFLELVDDNFGGIGLKSLLHAQYGPRDEQYYYRLRADRIFLTYFSFYADVHYSSSTDFLTDQHDDFLKIGDFRDTRIGLNLSLGRQIGRFGNVSISLNTEKVKVEAFPEEEFRPDPDTGIYLDVNERLDLRRFTIGTTVDTRDSYPFPSRGSYQEIYYETSGKILAGDLSYVKFFTMMSTAFTLRDRNTFEPRIVFGYADEALPYAQRFRWGGMHTFFGHSLNELHGRMIAAANLEYRYKLPVQNLFNIYFSLRYDLANIEEENNNVRFRDFQHAGGGIISLDFPFGPLEIGYGSTSEGKDRIYFSFGHRF